MKDAFRAIKLDRKIQLIFALFVFFVVWRVVVLFQPPAEDFDALSFWWGATYQLIALLGGIIGLSVASAWGGWRSAFGRSLQLFSLGLLFQSIGQAISSYYVYTTGDIPYPSLGDIGFFGSVIFYIFGISVLAKVIGIKSFFKSRHNLLLSASILIVAILGSYVLILNGHEHDWTAPISLALDFGYPILQAIYVAIAAVLLIVSRQYLGGMMSMPVLAFLIALIAQFLADFVFLYQTSNELYIPSGINDFMYLVAYFLMAFALLYTGNMFKKISAR